MTDEMRFCPNCGSTDVEPDTSNAGYMAVAGGNTNTWKCNDCGYNGMMPEGDPEEDFDEEKGEVSMDGEKLEFEPQEEYSREDTSFGRGYLKWVLYILVPLLVIYALTSVL